MHTRHIECIVSSDSPQPLPPSPQTGARLIDTSQPLKEQAAEAVLVRWQYLEDFGWQPRRVAAAEAASAAAEEGGAAASTTVPPPGYVEMPGFEGVDVGVREDALGSLRDLRPMAPRPSKVSAWRDVEGWVGSGG